MNTDKNTLGQELKLFRESLNLTLIQVQEATDISNSYLSQLENDKIKHPSANFLYKLSSIYNVPIERLLYSAGLISDEVYKHERIVTGIELTVEEERKLLQYLKFLRSKPSTHDPGSSRNPDPALQVKINITENYFPVQCQMCGWFGSSSELHGGSAIADTGDLDNCYCPVCGQCDTDECEEIISIFSYKDAYEKTKNILIQTKKALEEIHWKYISEKLN